MYKIFSNVVDTSKATLFFALVLSILCVNQRASAQGSNPDTVTVNKANKDLDEVVVTGYGTQKKIAVTAAIASVDAQKITDLVSPSFDRLLAGRAAGVDVVIPSGLVNEAPRIRIRGTNSISGNNSPLIVVDGLPLTVSGGISGATNDNILSFINTNDVKSIDILKDGAATAVYGSRAAAGVLLVTTKKGTKKDGISLSYNNNFGFSSAFRTHELLNAEQFVEIANEKFRNNGDNTNPAVLDTGVNTDWQATMLAKGAFSQSHNLSLSGATNKADYYASVNYGENQGLVLSNKVRKYGANLNLNFSPNKYIRAGVHAQFMVVQTGDQNNSGNALSGVGPGMLRALPNVRARDASNPTGYNIEPDGSALGRGKNKIPIENNYTNILYVVEKNQFLSNLQQLYGKAYIEILPFKGLSLKSSVGTQMFGGYDFTSYDPIHGDGRGSKGVVETQNINISNVLWQNLANYNTTIKGVHSISVLLGAEYQYSDFRYVTGEGTDILDPFFQQNALVSNSYANQFSSGAYSEFGFISYLGKINYDYREKYFAQVSVRQDEQSGLQPGSRSKVFPAVSLGWRISEEGFFAPIHKAFSELKLRASWAVVGNTVTPGTFPSFNTYSPAPYGGVNGLAFSQLGNSILQWETSQKWGVGLDMAFLKNNVTLSLDYYLNQNDGLILDAPTPNSYGVPNNKITKNVASMDNQGIELSLFAYVIRKKDFNWSLDFNFTWQTNSINKLYNTDRNLVPGPNTGTFNINAVGEQINAFYGYEVVGVNAQYGNPVIKKADGSLVMRDVKTGDYTALTSKDDTVTDKSLIGKGSLDGDKDRKILGSHIPAVFGGLISTFEYKNFTLEFQFRYAFGNKIYNLTRQESLLNMGFANNGVEILNRWTKPGDQTDVPRLVQGSDNAANYSSSLNSRFLEDASFLKLSYIKLAYSFVDVMNKNSFLKKAGFTDFTLFAQLQNVFMITSYTGLDPENRSSLGIDNNVLPQFRTISFGVKVAF